MHEALNERIELAIGAVKEQIEYFASHFGKVASDWKSDGSRVTEADIHLSHVFADIIGERFPDDQFFSEELDHGDSPLSLTAEFSWLLDPIDGTNNFARNMPNCSISLALLQHGSPVYGVIYDHASRSVIHGGPDRGLHLNGEPYQRRESVSSEQSLISVQLLSNENARQDDSALQMCFKLRAMGSSAIHMAYAALGWTDGVVAHRVKSWDIAAGVALLKAVGGSTRFFDTKVFPITEFSSKAKGFAHIAGPQDVCDAIEKAIDRECEYEF